WTADRLGDVPSKHAVRTISAAHAQPVFGPIQPHHPAPVDERYETRGRLCRVARTSPFGHARYQLRESADLPRFAGFRGRIPGSSLRIPEVDIVLGQKAMSDRERKRLNFSHGC